MPAFLRADQIVSVNGLPVTEDERTAFAEFLYKLSFREVQTFANEHNIRANGRGAQIAGRCFKSFMFGNLDWKPQENL